ncbi:MAG: hypothetical protein AB2693_27855 [Candidatus Thiodiazotropha sp.]
MVVFGIELIAGEGLILLGRMNQHSLSTETCDWEHNLIIDYPGIGHRQITTPFNYTLNNQYNAYSQRLLILSSDVELNPGPLTDKDEILQAIRASKDDVLGELRTVQQDIRSIRAEVSVMKQDQTKLKSDVSDVQRIQSDLEIRITEAEREVNSLKQENETLRLDIDYLSDQLDFKASIIDDLDKDVERLERYSRRDTIRVFGLVERVNERYDNIKQYVIDSVLKVACPDTEWSEDDIVRTHRIGYKVDDRYGNNNAAIEGNVNDKSRILLIKFLHWDKKMKVLKGREPLRATGIRVSDDLTKRQRQSLKALADRGQFGYYHRGELKIKEPRESGEQSASTRVYRRAQRRVSERIESDALCYPIIEVNENMDTSTFNNVPNDVELEPARNSDVTDELI